MVETRESCLEQSKNFNPRTKRCIETEASCRAKGKVYNERTRRCVRRKSRRANRKTRSNSSASASKSKSKSKSPSPEACSICLEPLDFKSRKNLFSGINCDHFFHKNCIQDLCKNNNKCKCPLCRQLLFHMPGIAQGHRDGPPPGVTARSNARIRNNTRRITPRSPEGPPPDLIPQIHSRAMNNIIRRQDSQEGPSSDLIQRFHSRAINNTIGSQDIPQSELTATQESMIRNNNRIQSIYNEIQSLNPNDPRRNQLYTTLRDAGTEQFRLYIQDANEKGIPRETYINSILPNSR